MIMDWNRTVVIPRRTAGIESIGINAGGMLGMIWTDEEETVQRWVGLGPRRLLETAGIPKLLKR